MNGEWRQDGDTWIIDVGILRLAVDASLQWRITMPGMLTGQGGKDAREAQRACLAHATKVCAELKSELITAMLAMQFVDGTDDTKR